MSDFLVEIQIRDFQITKRVGSHLNVRSIIIINTGVSTLWVLFINFHKDSCLSSCPVLATLLLTDRPFRILHANQTFPNFSSTETA
jgi:hypothetical protein